MKQFIIDPSNVDPNPIEQFRLWFEEYKKTQPVEPSAMFLATADNSGTPSGRVVLLKDFNYRGFVFYTNYESRKGRDLKENAQASLTFYWDKLSRQVRVFGKVEKVTAEESDDYFATRPFESRLGACVSKQGSVVESREVLVDELLRLKAKYEKTQQVPRPDYWGGFRVIPSRVEFWQGRDNRIHDRVEYVLEGKEWKLYRLSP